MSTTESALRANNDELRKKLVETQQALADERAAHLQTIESAVRVMAQYKELIRRITATEAETPSQATEREMGAAHAQSRDPAAASTCGIDGCTRPPDHDGDWHDNGDGRWSVDVALSEGQDIKSAMRAHIDGLPLASIAGWVVQLDSSAWLINGSTPEWVTLLGNAKIYKDASTAKGELTKARKMRPFGNGCVIQVGLVEMSNAIDPPTLPERQHLGDGLPVEEPEHHEPKWLDSVPDGYTGPLWVLQPGIKAKLVCYRDRDEWSEGTNGWAFPRKFINTTSDVMVQIPRPAR